MSAAVPDTDIKTDIEYHPWPPFIPDGARILIAGTFPPGEHRRAMEFYYPNRSNDFWKAMGLIFENDVNAYYDPQSRSYDLDKIKRMLTERRIALSDTGRAVRRLRGNASDKYLEIIEPFQLYEILSAMPCCHDVATTGQKAAEVLASLTSTEAPAMGSFVTSADRLRLWRMPSTSRAYPLAVDKKAAYYAAMFETIGIL